EDLVATEPFTAYIAFMNAADKLYFSYPVKQDGNGDSKISPYIQRIVDNLELTVKYRPAEAISLAGIESKTEEDLLSFIGSPRLTLSQLLLVMRQAKETNQPPSAFWIQLFRYFYTQYKGDRTID